MEMCFHGNQHLWAIKHPFISLCFKYHSLNFICLPVMNSPVFPSLDDIYCRQTDRRIERQTDSRHPLTAWVSLRLDSSRSATVLNSIMNAISAKRSWMAGNNKENSHLLIFKVPFLSLLQSFPKYKKEHFRVRFIGFCSPLEYMIR